MYNYGIYESGKEETIFKKCASELLTQYRMKKTLKDRLRFLVRMPKVIYRIARSTEYCIENFGVSVTERCTLKCKYCATFFPYIKNPKDYDLKAIKNDAEKFLKAARYVHNLALVGGEIMILPNLHVFIREFLKLEDYYTYLYGVSNGTISPDKARNGDALLKAMRKDNFQMLMSDYKSIVPNRYEFVRTLKKNKIRIEVVNHKYWFRPATERSNMTDEQLKIMFETCEPCPGIYDGKYFPCGRTYRIVNHLGTELWPSDYIDLRNSSIKEIRKRLHGFFYEVDFLETCRYCGHHPMVWEKIGVAEQLE